MIVTKAAKTVGKKASKASKKSPKKAVTPQAKAQRAQIRLVRRMFDRLGFNRAAADGKEITFRNRTGEFDDIFLVDNVMVLAEYTVGQTGTSHVAGKSFLFNQINSNQSEWVEFAAGKYPDVGDYVEAAPYEFDEYRVCICYFSTQGVSDEVEGQLEFVSFLDGTKFRYFDALAKTIFRTARWEFFKYLKLDFSEIGSQVNGSQIAIQPFPGYVLPEKFSSFPKEFKVVSFYADPNALLTMSYVLRRDSWRDEEGIYQRVLQRVRMNQMRKYLTTEERVFVNNIIVTLPADTQLNEKNNPGKNIDPKMLSKVKELTVAVPLRSNTIGIVDGQHRVFCYHEGQDKYEAEIATLRSRQNLLVTGIIYPEGYAEVDKRRFEAKLFLEINDKQKRTGSELKQSIELILNPFSNIAISKAVVQRLNTAGPLKGLLQTNYFDPNNLIRTTSIVSYGLRPLLKLDGEDSLFSAWSVPSKHQLQALQKAQASGGDDGLLADYVLFCSRAINDLLVAIKVNDDQTRWKLADSAKDRHLSPTILNGYFYCLRLLVRNGTISTKASYQLALPGVATFDYSKYKSSHWNRLGEAFYKTYFQ